MLAAMRRWWVFPPLGLALSGAVLGFALVSSEPGGDIPSLNALAALFGGLLGGAAGLVLGALASTLIWIALVVWRRVARRPAGR